VGVPRESGRRCAEAGAVDLVVDLLRVAVLDTRDLSGRQSLLNREHTGGFIVRHAGGVAEQPEHPLEVGEVRRAYRDELFVVVLQIVVAVGHSEAS